MIMIPNIVWFMIPAPIDVLRNKSVTGTIDTVASICQVLFVTAMCITTNKKAEQIRLNKAVTISIIFAVMYYVGWIFYYLGNPNTLLIWFLAIAPCLSFVCFILDRKNMIALIPASIFTVCHVIYALVNFIL